MKASEPIGIGWRKFLKAAGMTAALGSMGAQLAKAQARGQPYFVVRR